jgi:hypothetical protein
MLSAQGFAGCQSENSANARASHSRGDHGNNVGHEFAASGLLLAHLITHWATTRRRVTFQNQQSAQRLLGLLMKRFFQGRQFTSTIMVEDKAVELTFSDGKCQVHASEGWLRVKTVRHWLNTLPEDGLMVSELTINAHREALGIGKHVVVAREVVKQLLYEFYMLVEECVDANAWSDDSHPLDLPILRNAGQRRSRQIAPCFKVGAVSAAHTGDYDPDGGGARGTRKVENLMSGMRVWANVRKRKYGEEVATPAKRTAIRFNEDCQMVYLGIGLNKFKNAKHCSVALDGMRSGGEEILQLAFYSVTHRLACWLPVQAGTHGGFNGWCDGGAAVQTTF